MNPSRPFCNRLLLASACFAVVAALPATTAMAGDHIHHGFCGHPPGDAGAFNANNRWDRTATDGPGLGDGDATTITWSFVPNGTQWTQGANNLISFLDNIIGAGPGGSDLTQRPWFDSFQESFDRWGELGGISYVYEPNDDGAAGSGPLGFLGVRGDVRIGGGFIDGNGGVLAFNSFPDNGDMTFDTGDSNFYGDPFANFRPLRNVIMHEHGHGMGLGHVESDNAEFLMEPFINTNFDGPQLDDIRGLHRGYGDRLEKNGGNDTFGNAHFLGNANNATLAIGLDGGTGTRVVPTETDFISIDDNGDLDFFSFAIDGLSTLDVLLTPLGATYRQAPQGGTQSSTDTSATSNLAFTLFDSDGITVLANVNATGNGQAETLAGFGLDDAGTYFIRVTGDANNMQFYSLALAATLVPEPTTLALAGLAMGGLLRRRRSA